MKHSRSWGVVLSLLATASTGRAQEAEVARPEIQSAIRRLADPFERERASRWLLTRFDEAGTALLASLRSSQAEHEVAVLVRAARAGRRPSVDGWLDRESAPSAAQLRATVELGLLRPPGVRRELVERLDARIRTIQTEARQRAFPMRLPKPGGEASTQHDLIRRSRRLEAAMEELQLGPAPTLDDVLEALRSSGSAQKAGVRSLVRLPSLDSPELRRRLVALARANSQERIVISRILMRHSDGVPEELQAIAAESMLKGAVDDVLVAVLWLREHPGVGFDLMGRLTRRLDAQAPRLTAEVLVTISIVAAQAGVPMGRAEALRALRTARTAEEAGRLRSLVDGGFDRDLLLSTIEGLTEHGDPQVARRAKAALRRASGRR